jgi:hypothetical protein
MNFMNLEAERHRSCPVTFFITFTTTHSGYDILLYYYYHYFI